MKTKVDRITLCCLVGLRAERLDRRLHARAWEILSEEIQKLGGFEMPMPKFKGLIRAVRTATIKAGKS